LYIFLDICKNFKYFIMTFFKLTPLALFIAFAACDQTTNNPKPIAQKVDTVKTIKVADDKGNTIEVPVAKPITLYQPKVDSTKPFLYLTWDDGPNEGTPNINKLLKQYHIPMSLFLVGRNATSPNYMKMYQEQAAMDNVTFHNHSWSHANGRYQSYYSSPAGVVEDFTKCRNIFQLTNKISRGPGRNAWRVGSINATDIRASTRAIDSLTASGFNVIGWDIEWRFKYAGGVVNPVQTADQMLAEIAAGFAAQNMHTKNHMVMLAHDQMFTTPDHMAQLSIFFDKLLKENKYNIAYITNYPECKGL
jgi:peptidoglycan-N-acetylglucosamine deacetylase